jgi:hypothetical protein
MAPSMLSLDNHDNYDNNDFRSSQLRKSGQQHPIFSDLSSLWQDLIEIPV